MSEHVPFDQLTDAERDVLVAVKHDMQLTFKQDAPAVVIVADAASLPTWSTLRDGQIMIVRAALRDVNTAMSAVLNEVARPKKGKAPSNGTAPSAFKLSGTPTTQDFLGQDAHSQRSQLRCG